MDNIREKFELQISIEYERPPCLVHDEDGYYDSYVDNAWWGWQAATEQSQKEVEALQAREKVLVEALGTAQDELTHLSHHTREDYARDCVNKIFNSIEQALANVNNEKKG